MTARATHMETLVAEARPAVYWSDRSDAPVAEPSLVGATTADLVVIGGGFTGLWTALHALQRDPGRSVAVLEAEVCGFGASTRNGGFCEASLTHGYLNGLSHWPDDFAALERMGNENLDDLISTCEQLGIDAEIERTGALSVATAEWQTNDLRDAHELAVQHGIELDFLDEAGVQAEVSSPTYRSGLLDQRGAAMVHPARLTWGLKRACLDAGVRIFDNSRVAGVERSGAQLTVATERGTITAPKVIVATNAWAEPERSIRRYVVPIYDHVLMTEPLTAAQLASVGWARRCGVGDSANQFHYSRLTADNRILWGGYDANYYRNNGMGAAYENRTASHVLIAGHFFDTYPQLEGLRFSHRWAGPIGTTSKFAVAFGQRQKGDLVWVGGYTGLGVGASRWAALVALDLVDGHDTERAALRLVQKKPFPFPPEPLRSPIIQYTRRQIAKADQNDGKPGIWLRVLERFGVGFDS